MVGEPDRAAGSARPAGLVRLAAARPAWPPGRVPGCGRRAGSPARPRRIGVGPGRLRSGPVRRSARRHAAVAGWARSASVSACAVAASAAGSRTANTSSQDPLLQPPPAEALAALLAAIQLFGAAAQIARAVALRAGVAGLHHPAALAAPQPALQQRRSLPRCAAAEPARRPPVRAQPCGVGLEAWPSR